MRRVGELMGMVPSRLTSKLPVAEATCDRPVSSSRRSRFPDPSIIVVAFAPYFAWITCERANVRATSPTHSPRRGVCSITVADGEAPPHPPNCVFLEVEWSQLPTTSHLSRSVNSLAWLPVTAAGTLEGYLLVVGRLVRHLAGLRVVCQKVSDLISPRTSDGSLHP